MSHNCLATFLLLFFMDAAFFLAHRKMPPPSPKNLIGSVWNKVTYIVYHHANYWKNNRCGISC